MGCHRCHSTMLSASRSEGCHRPWEAQAPRRATRGSGTARAWVLSQLRAWAVAWAARTCVMPVWKGGEIDTATAGAGAAAAEEEEEVAAAEVAEVAEVAAATSAAAMARRSLLARGARCVYPLRKP